MKVEWGMWDEDWNKLFPNSWCLETSTTVGNLELLLLLGWNCQNSSKLLIPISPGHTANLSLPEIASCWILNCMLRLGFSSGLGAPDCKFTSPLRLGSFCGVIFPTSHASTFKRQEKKIWTMCWRHAPTQNEAVFWKAGEAWNRHLTSVTTMNHLGGNWVAEESSAAAGVENQVVELPCLDLHSPWEGSGFLKMLAVLFKFYLYVHVCLCGVVYVNTESMEAKRGCGIRWSWGYR